MHSRILLTRNRLEALHALADLDLDGGGRGGGGLEPAHRVGQVGAVAVGGARRAGQLGLQRAAAGARRRIDQEEVHDRIKQTLRRKYDVGKCNHNKYIQVKVKCK